MAKILVVDDEATWLEIYERNFGRLGHDVVKADNLPGAIAVFDKEKSSLDLVWTDLDYTKDLADRSGLHLIQRVHSEDPSIRVVLMSTNLGGLSETAIKDVRVLSKTAGLSEIIDALKEELAQRPKAEEVPANFKPHPR